MFGFSTKKIAERRQSFETEALPHLADLYRTARWMTRNREDAEDLVQETLSEALKSFHRYQAGTNCRAWMTKIMYHLNGKRIRKLGRMKLVEDADEMIAETVPFEPSIPPSLTDEDMIAAVKRVPENFRQILLLADVEEFAYKEIAEMIQVPIGTVMSRLHRGRKLLRMELAEFARDAGILGTGTAGGKG